jgi:hypothetical protein
LHEDLAMIGEIKDDIPVDEVDDGTEDVETEDLDGSETIVEVADVDNVGDISVEINVEELVAKLEATDDDDSGRKREIHKRLEELEEERRTNEDLDSTYNFNLDDDL